MRTQYCRIKIVEGAGEKCHVSPDTISDLKKVLKFVEEHPGLSELPTSAIKPLMAIPDSQEREKATSSVSKALKSKKNPATGKFTKRVTEKDVLKTIEKVAPSALPEPQPVLKAIENPTAAPQTLADKIKEPPAPVLLTEEQKRRQNREKQIEAAQAFIALIPLSKQNAITQFRRDAHVETDADFLIQAIDLALEVAE